MVLTQSVRSLFPLKGNYPFYPFLPSQSDVRTEETLYNTRRQNSGVVLIGSREGLRQTDQWVLFSVHQPHLLVLSVPHIFWVCAGKCQVFPAFLYGPRNQSLKFCNTFVSFLELCTSVSYQYLS